jgi:glycosyltransferase involved in cell wall biosynthesis
MAQQVSVIVTVLNEAESIRRLVGSLSLQTRQPDEVVIVDGGSTDGTLEELERALSEVRFPLRVLSEPGCNISEGRNAAISAARGALIAATDAGVRLDEEWLANLIAPFGGDAPPDVVSGFVVAESQSTFELALGAVTLPQREEIDPNTFHPSSRSVAFRREAWQAVGGYPEWLDYCEDLLFDFALRDAGFTFAFAPRALAFFRPRSTLRAFFRQYYRYARGDGKADFWRYRHLVRYVAYLVVVPALLGLAIGYHPLWLLGLVGGLVAIVGTPFQRLRSQLAEMRWSERLAALLWVPVIRVAGDAAKMLGYPVGVWWRWRHAPQEPWPKRQF